MSITEDLVLDLRQANAALDALERQIESTFTSIPLTVDTAGISREISGAVAAADNSIAVEANTTGITPEITRAVDQADTEVVVQADTSAARREVRRLDDDLQKAQTSASGLRGLLTGATLIAGARGLFALAEASSAVNEQVTGSEIVFDELAISVQRFAEQADRIGLAEAQALALSNQFGQLALSAGLADQAVVDFATTIVARGADIASLRDLDLTETLAALQSGLVGETEPLRRLGIFINEAVVQNEAYRAGIADVGEELTDAQKIQSRYNLILQQSAIAQGNFALTAEGLANKQRQVRAALVDLAADSGRLLEPTFLSLFDVAEDQLIPSLERLAEEALPAVGDILEELAPLLGVTIDLLVAGAPLLEVIADVLGAIPEPLFAVAAGWLAINRAQRLATAAGNIASIQAMTQGVSGLAGVLGTRLIPGVAGTSALGIAGLVGGIVAVTDEGARNRVGAFAGEITNLADALTFRFGARREERVSGEIEKLIAGLDTSNIGDAQVAIRRLHEELAALGDVAGPVVDLGPLRTFKSNEKAENFERAEQLHEQIDLLNEQARAEILAGIETGRFTDAQVAATKAQTDREKPVSAIIRQLQLLRLEEEQQARLDTAIINKYQGIADQYVNTAEAAKRLRTAVPEVEAAVAGIRLGGDTDQKFLGLATAIDTAGLSGEELGDVAALLGTDIESLGAFVDTTTGALQSFIDTAVGGLPTVTTAFDDALADAQDAASRSGELIRSAAEDRAQAITDAASARVTDAGKNLGTADAQAITDAAQERADAIREAAETEASALEDAARVTVGGLTESLQARADQLADFRTDLDALTAAGFADIAGLLAQQGIERGDALADELTTALDSGNVALLEGLREANKAFEQESQTTVAFIRDELGPELLSVTGLIASAVSENFGSELDFGEKLRIAGALATSELDSQGQQIAAIAAVEGEAAARSFGAALQLDQAVIDAGVAAGKAIQSEDLNDQFSEGGAALGRSVAEGIGAGIASYEEDLKKFGASLFKAIETGVREEGAIFSPSRVMMGLGANVVQGLTLGLQTEGAAAVTAMRDLTSEMVTQAGATMAAVASRVPSFGVRSGVSDIAAQAGRLHPQDLEQMAQLIATAVGPRQLAGDIVVNNPSAATAESSICRELTSIKLRTGEG